MRELASFSMFFATFFVSMSEAQEKRVQCEKIVMLEDNSRETSVYRKTCFMYENTNIDSRGFFISSTEDNEMQQLSFTYNSKIFFLPENIDEKFPNIVRIEADGCSIKSISNGVFDNLIKLEYLDLYNNQIEKIENNLFKDLKSLEHLDLCHNEIKIVEENAFKGLAKLKKLTLYNNQIEKIKNNLFKDLKSLEHLDLCGNKIKIFEENAFKGLAKLKTLNLRNSQIEKIENNLFEDLKSLEDLNLGGNEIKIVEENAFKGLAKLKELTLYENQIEKIENNLFEDLKSLEYLHLNGNKIKFMNGKIFASMKNLKYVNLVGNVCIEKEIGDYFSTISNKVLSELIEIVSNQCGFKDIFDFDCGKVRFGSGLVIGGNEVKRGQWPFLVSLAHVESKSHFCGGNLITNKHVLTAAHCLQNKDHKDILPASKIIVNLGKYDLAATDEPNAVIRNVQESFVHPDWNYKSTRWDADLAILLMDEPVEFSSVIKRVCLPQSWETFEAIDEGTVVGWGKSEFASRARPTEDIPRQAMLKVINDSHCYRTDQDIARMSSLRTFCAGGDGAGPCTGDSGGGLYTNIGTTWYLRGITSSSVLTGFSCDVNTFAIYTKVSDFFKWIRDTATVT